MYRDYTKLENLLRMFEEKKSAPGGGCAVMQNDELVYSGAYGYADLAAGKRADQNTMYRQGEASFLFTTIALAMLAEEGKLIYSDPVSEYLPEYANPKKFAVAANGKITVEPLRRPMTIHTAVSSMTGHANILTPMAETVTPTQDAMNARLKALYAKGTVPTLREEVRAMGDVPVMFEPYSHWEYGFGLQIVGAIIEEIEGKPLRQVFEDRIIQPMGLKSTATFITDENRDRVAVAYKKNADGSFTPDEDANHWYDPAQVPVGARPFVLASAEDYAVVMQMLANGGTFRGEKFLGSGTVSMMHSVELENHHIPDYIYEREREGYLYCMGFHNVVRQKYGYNGHFDNFAVFGDLGTWAEADPTAKLATAYMHNMTPNNNVFHHHRIRTVVYGIAL